ncbi:hypothetical protein EHM94_18210 [Marinobacter sp. NP-6]|uniref:cytochrome C oxidase subunit IV family protein n=1 Tax=Marinobacter sp. NP-6 TaxID=2488666 RepID=UPI000FCAB682|nr:cytochrome C oxidase subunit IV family protein [Marinobacter sp. NP-6]RUT76963.1 hypothetical protein EHM94_18210 [Marinobacter sp. NP-6]
MFLNNDTIDRAWLILMIATVASAAITQGVGGKLAVAATVLGIALIKGRLVALDFMELRHAPFKYRMIFEGWLIVTCLALLAGYAAGLKAIA